MRLPVSRALWSLAFCLSGGIASLACQLPASAQGNAGSVAGSASQALPVAAACSAEGVGADSAIAVLPAQLGAFCLDRHAPPRAYGASDSAPLARACERVLGPGCLDERLHGLDRVVTLRYLKATDPEGSVEVVLSRFEDTDGAYAHFTQSLIGERDPLGLELHGLELPGAAVLEAGNVIGWRGRHVFRLRYSDARETLDQLLATAEQYLPELARQVSESLPDEAGLPEPVQRLPEAERLPFGVRLVLGDALGVAGLGTSARGYYRDGDKRWRVLAMVRPDSESAKDVLGTLGRRPETKKIKGAPFDAVQFIERRLPSEPHVGWVVGQRGNVIYGIGDEATVLPEFMPARQEARVKLSLHEKLVKLTRIHLK
jgi:hypothetical protein